MTATQLSCPPPDPNPRPPLFKVPPQACDCHAHIIGPVAQYPFVADRSYTPPDALLPAYLKVLESLGLERMVLVQPSMHGADNTVMMNALAAAKHVEGRAVVVVPPNISDHALERLHRQGAKGVRLNLIYSGGGMGLEAADTLAARISVYGWHLQLLINAAELGREVGRLARLKVPVVIDHIGHLPTARGVRDAGFQALLDLVRAGNTWVKLTGPYRLTREEYPYEDVRPFVDALLEAGPQRLVWGTDWPHTVCQVRMPNDGELLDLLQTWVWDDRLRAMILVDNPARLYGFE